jgi:hypothetical protein
MTGHSIAIDLTYPSGLAIVVRENANSPAQKAVEAALSAAGQPVRVAINRAVAEGAFRIIIGPK